AAGGYSRPTAVTNLAATQAGNQVSLAWTAATASNAPIARYFITTFNNGNAQNSLFVAGTASTAKITGLAAGVAYTFTVTASNAYGDGPTATSPSATPTGASATYASGVIGSSPVAYYSLSATAGNLAA